MSAASLVAGAAPHHSRGSLALPISTKLASTKVIRANLISTQTHLYRPTSTELLSINLISIRLALTNLSLSNLYQKLNLLLIIVHLISLKLFSAKLISSKTYHRVRIDRLLHVFSPCFLCDARTCVLGIQ